MPPPLLSVICPPDVTVDDCHSSQEVDILWDTWLSTFAYDGGCNVVENISAPSEPPGEGESAVVVYTVADSCGQSVSCSSTFSRTFSSPPIPSCPGELILPPCSSKETIDEAFQNWINQFSFTGGCGTIASDLSAYVPPDSCGGTIQVEYLVEDSLGRSAFCSANFTIPAPIQIVVKVPSDLTLAACTDEAFIQFQWNNWIAQFAYSGGCHVSATDLSTLSPPTVCGGSVTVAYEVKDPCLAAVVVASTFNLPEECNIVTNTNSSGIGSLRYIIECSEDGDTIRFDPSLDGQTMILQIPTIQIQNKSIILSGHQVENLLITNNDASNFEPLISVRNGSLKLMDINIEGQAPESVIFFIRSNGALVLKDSKVTNSVLLRSNN